MKIHEIEAPYVGPCMRSDGAFALREWSEIAHNIAPAFEHTHISLDMVPCSNDGVHYIIGKAKEG